MNGEDLTQKEKEVFKMLCINGMSAKEIAQTLFIEETTIKTHLQNICGKLGFFGHSRLLTMTVTFWREVTIKMMNCEKCKFNFEGRCYNKSSQFYTDDVSFQMICTKFKPSEIKENEAEEHEQKIQ